MRYPAFLPKGGTIGLIAPSFGCATEPYRSLLIQAEKVLQQRGYRLLEGPNARACEGIGKSNTPEKCGAEVNDFFLNRPVDVILSCGGGETMCEDLPYIDFQAIAAAPPKWFMGYSDNTNLTFTLPVLCDTAAIYGPCVSAFGPRQLHSSCRDALEILCGERREVSNYPLWEKEALRTEEDVLAPMNPTEPFGMKIILPAAEGTACSFSGRLIGGCLDILQLLAGTKYGDAPGFAERYKEDGIIWFLEACDLGPLSIRRALWQLENAGWFRYVKGFVIGRSLCLGEEVMGMDSDRAYVGQLSKYGVPILLDVDLGHLPPMMPIISGACAAVRAERGAKGPSLTISYSFE